MQPLSFDYDDESFDADDCHQEPPAPPPAPQDRSVSVAGVSVLSSIKTLSASVELKIFQKELSLEERKQVKLYKSKSSRIKWWHAIFFFSGISVVACLCQLFLPYPYGLMMTSAEIAAVGIVTGCKDGLERCICPIETVCAANTLSIVLLAVGRCSAFFNYPLYMMMFLTKCHNINNLLRRTVLREWIDFADTHKVHKIFGFVVGIETMSHSFFHILRWELNRDMNLMWETSTGITGMIAAFVTPFICWPMAIEYLKQRIKFEVRKGIHYLSVVWAIALLFHAPSRIYYLIGVPAVIYLLDYTFGFFIRNSLIENVFFERYGENGVALHFENPSNWEAKPKTSYVYVMCPWISKYQWHIFTIFPEPQKENHTMLCIGASGDWTKELHEKVKVPCYRSMYVIGPFKSQFSDAAVTTSNAIAVASGIGITPTLSLILNYIGKKRINVVWTCRDAGLIEYILHKVDIEAITKKSYLFIFYTGKRELALPLDLSVNVFIIKSRPQLEHTITGIITSIHSGEGLPEALFDDQQKFANAPFHERMKIALSRVVETYGEQEMFEYAREETEKQARIRTGQDLECNGALPTSSLIDGADTESGNGSSMKHWEETRRLVVSRPFAWSDSFAEGQVSLKGLDAMIQKFLGGIGEYSHNDIVDLFQKIDSDSSGFIDQNEFGEFLNLATKDKAKFSKVSSQSSLIRQSSIFSTQTAQLLGGERTVEYMKRIADSTNLGESPLEDWSVFYCGGSNKIKDDLKEISRKYGLGFAVEKFDW